MFSQIKDRKHIEQNFHSVARVMPWGWDLGGAGGESKTLAWGFAMASHGLRSLLLFCIHVNHLYFILVFFLVVVF